MPFAAALRNSLQDRGNDVPAEFKRGDSLEDVGLILTLGHPLAPVVTAVGEPGFRFHLLVGDAGVAVLVETDYFGCDFVDFFTVARIGGLDRSVRHRGRGGRHRLR